MDLTPQQVEQRNKQAQLERAMELDDLGSVLSTKQGRRFIWRFLKEAGIFRDYADVNNVYLAYKKAGERNLALRFFVEIVEHFPERYLEMQREHKIPKSVPRQPAEER